MRQSKSETGGVVMVIARGLSAAGARRTLIVLSLLAALSVAGSAHLWAQEIQTPEQVLVTNIFDSTDIISVLRDISAQTGVNILAEPSVQGWITMELLDVPLEDALDMIVGPLGYTWVRQGNYYIVGSADAQNPAYHMFTSTEVIRLRYAKAEAVAELLSDFFKPNVKVDPVANVIMVTGIRSIIDRIKADIALVDKPARQVILEAVVMEMTTDSGKDNRADWRVQASVGASDPVMPLSGFVDFVSGIWSGKLSMQGGLTQLLASIEVMVDSGQAEINATPKLMALDGETAEIFLGREKYITVSTTTTETMTQSRLESIKTGITLRFTPRITDSGEIIMKIEPEVSDAVEVTGGFPIVNRRTVSTTVMLRDGETLVIGGLKLKSEYDSSSKVPVLGDLPVLGLLFSSNKKASVETETVVLITPRIVELGSGV